MTGNKEDYLKAIYELGGRSKRISNKDIAEKLNVSAPSVSEMVKKLLKEGYVEYTVYQGVSLTEYGVEEAMKIRRRHLLWEVFLVEKLGYSWDEVNEEAERLEHVTSLKLEKSLDKYLGYPKFCPHGTPILKDRDCNLNYRILELLSIGDKATIQRISDIKELLQYVSHMGLNIGDRIEVIDIKPTVGTIVVRKDGTDISLKREFAKKIYVE